MARTKAAPAVAPASEPVSAPSGEIENLPVESAAIEAAPPPEASESAPEPVERPLSAREQMMAEIVAKRNAILESEVAEGRAQGGEPEPEPAAPPQDALNPPAAPRAAAEPSAAPAAAAADATPQPRVHKILIAGRHIDIPEDDLYRAAELGIMAEARRHQEAQRSNGSAPQPIPSAGPSSPPAAAPANPQAPPSGLTEDESLEIARALQYGDEKEVADAVRRMTAQRQASQPAIDQAAIARDVHERVGAQLRLENDLNAFASAFPDIIQDEDLTTLAGQRAQQLRNYYVQHGVQVSERDLMFQAGQLTREKFQTWAGGAAQPQPTLPAPSPAPAAASGESARTIIKRSTPNAPAAAGAIPTTPAQRAMSPKDVVNWMRQSRGQPVYN